MPSHAYLSLQIVGRYGEERKAETDEEEDFKEPGGYTVSMGIGGTSWVLTS